MSVKQPAPHRYRFRSIRIVSTSHSHRHLAMAVIGVLSLIICGLIVSPWQQYAAGLGTVIAYAPDERLQVISSPVDGRISKWFVAEGLPIKSGAPIVELADVDPNILERLKLELDSAVAKRDAAQSGLEISELNLGRQKELSSKGLSSQRTFELAQIEYNKMLADLQSANGELARVQVRFSRQSSQTVTAPTDGVVQRVYGSKGGVVVKTGDPLALLAPQNNSRAVELFIDSNDLPLITVGRSVRLQFEGWPAIQIVGWPSLAIGTFGGVVQVIDPTDSLSNGRSRVIVFPDPADRPWPESQFLRLGNRSQGWVLLDVVDLWFEIWRRFNGFPKSAPHNLFQSLQVPHGESKKDEK